MPSAFATKIAPVRVAVTPDLTRDQIPGLVQRLSHRLTWTTASIVLLCVLRNAIACGCIAFGLGFVVAQGNWTSWQSPIHQSNTEFATASFAHASCFALLASVAVLMENLLACQFLKHQEASLSFLQTVAYCLQRLMARSWHQFLLAEALLTVIVYLTVEFSLETMVATKYHVYVMGLVMIGYMVSLDITTRMIYQQETVQGTASGRRYHPTSFCLRWLRGLRRHLPTNIIVVVGLSYAHLISVWQFTQSGLQLALFSVLSCVMKLLLQSIARYHVMRKKATPRKSMYLIIVIPTVMIDTQVRIAMLRYSFSSANETDDVTWLGAAGLAVLEIVVRLVKILYLRVDLRRSTRRYGLSVTVEQCSEGKARKISRQSTAQTYRNQLLLFYAVESVADMHAEYLAIVCSTSVCFFFARHPMYHLDVTDHASSESYSSDTTWLSSNAAMLLVQFGLEMVVDFLCVLLETASHVPLRESNTIDWFASALFMREVATNLMVFSATYFQGKQT